MKKLLLLLPLLLTALPLPAAPVARTSLAIKGEDFHLNGQITYRGRSWQGHRIEGLLMNSRMVQATFDDLNPETAPRWAYPDTGKWDPERNVSEFIAAVSEHVSWGWFDYRRKGEGFGEGYQSPPVNWGISSDRKRGFFKLLAEITGSPNP